MNTTSVICHPTFSTIGCGWDATNVSAAYAVWAALFVASCSAAGTIIGGLITRFAHMGWDFNLIMEATLTSLLSTMLHIVLWLGPVITNNGGTPYPIWLALLFWSAPFIFLVRAQFMSFTTILLPMQATMDGSAGRKVRLFSLLPSLVGIGVTIAMCIIGNQTSNSQVPYLIFVGGYGILALSLCLLAVRALLLIREHLDVQSVTRQKALLRLRRWSRFSLFTNLLWVVSFVVRAVVTFTSDARQPVHWLLWIVIDTVWFSVTAVLIGLLVERDDITEKTSKIYRPESVVYMSTSDGERAKSVFLTNFSPGEVKISVTSGRPIFLHIPSSFKELISYPHPANEIENRLHAVIHAFITCPLAILLLNYANWPWMSFIISSSLFLRFAFANRIDPQAWLVFFIAKLVEPDWWPGAPKRFGSFVLAVFNMAAFIFGICGLKAVSTWLLAVIIILSVNQMLGFCLACALFVIATKVGVLPESVCSRCMQRFVNGVPEEYCPMPNASSAGGSTTKNTGTGTGTGTGSSSESA